MTTAIVLLGSNIEPEVHLPRGIERLRGRVALGRVSRIYRSPPAGAAGPAFLNAAVSFPTELDPVELKHGLLRPIEAELGRVRTGDRNAPRTLDLDLVLLGRRVVDDREAGVTLPDPDLLRHAYAAVPVAEVAPEGMVHPVTGEPLVDLAARLRAVETLEVLPEGVG